MIQTICAECRRPTNDLRIMNAQRVVVCASCRDITCEKCNHIMRVGDYPFCPHEMGSQAVVGDDVPGGFVAENGFDAPTRFYSKKAHRDALAAQGLTIKAKWAGPQDKHLSRMDAPSAKTLEDAKVLLMRGAQARTERQQHLASVAASKAEFPITVTTIPWSE